MHAREIFCSSATTRAERFSPDKSSALLQPQKKQTNKKKHSATVAFGNWGSRTPEIFSGEKHSAIVVTEQQKFCLVRNILQLW